MRSQREGRSDAKKTESAVHPVGQWASSVSMSRDGAEGDLASRMPSLRGLSVTDIWGSVYVALGI